MKHRTASRADLLSQLADVSKQLTVCRMALAHFAHPLTVSRADVVTAGPTLNELYQFYFFDLEQAHGGLIAIRHAVQQPRGRRDLVTMAAYYLDDLDDTLRHLDPTDSYWRLMSGPVRAAKLKREAVTAEPQPAA